MKYKIGFIGMGNMASSIVGGMIEKQILLPTEVIGSRRNADSLEEIQKKYGISVTGNNIEVVQESEILVLAVKPQFMEEVIREIKDYVTDKHLIISIAPGKTLDWFSTRFQQQVKMIRCMPNTPILVLEGCTGYCCSEGVSQEAKERFVTLFSVVSKLYEVKESLMSAVVGISGSSPAYFFMMVEAMADAGVLAGIPRDIAYEMAAQSMYGSAKMVLETGQHPGKLKDQVCSPGGTTIEAVATLEKTGFRSSIIEAIGACIEKSESL